MGDTSGSTGHDERAADGIDPTDEPLGGVRVAFVVANEGVEQVELLEPWRVVVEAGGSPSLVAPQTGTVQLMNHLDRGGTREATVATADARPADFDALVLPGGVANPDHLRTDRPAVEFVGAMFRAGRPATVICHGPWTLVEADVVRDRTLTSWPSLRTDIGNAGGHWVDEEVTVCTGGPNTLVTSRRPDDLAAFCDTFTAVFARLVRTGEGAVLNPAPRADGARRRGFLLRPAGRSRPPSPVGPRRPGRAR